MKLADQIRTIMEENDNLTDEQLGQAVDSFYRYIRKKFRKTDWTLTTAIATNRRHTVCWRFFFDAFPLTKEDVLLDYGSGLGRLAFYSAARFGCPCIGVEMAEKWYTTAENNRLSFVTEDADIHFILDTADHYEVDDRVTYIYCFNPFFAGCFPHSTDPDRMFL